jgi:large subunit ribosomal protein L2
MALKKYNPTTPAQRGLVLVDNSELWKGKPHKQLVEGKNKKGGRNNLGHLTAPRKGGGHKQKYRIIDFKRRTAGEATVERLEYDPNRTSHIALIKYDATGEYAYIIAPQRLKVGDKVESGEKVEVKTGNAMPMKNIPVGTLIHNIELKPGRGAQFVRSAGGYAQLVGKDGGYAQVKLRSGELRMIPADCMATIGAISNPDHQNQNFGKAGRSRWKGIRPTVRGVAMNPVDHPHGGGEGKTSGGRHPVTPWGKPTKGYKTRSRKKVNKLVIRTRHQAKKKKG